MKKTELITIVAVAGLVSLFYYGPFLDNYFVWDDFMMLENYYTRSFKDFLFGFGDLRLFGNSFLWLNCLVSGFNPLGYSLISISIHIANSIMLSMLIYSLFSDKLLSIFVAIIFAASAVAADAILWKCAFLTVTGLFFYLLILYLYIEGEKRGKSIFHNAALFVFIVAILNKESIASIPFMLLFIEMSFLKDKEGFLTKLKKVIPYFITIVLYILLSVMVSRTLNLQQEQFERFLTFRPFHTLFSGFTSFFISPDGIFNWKNPFIYLTVVLVTCYYLLRKDRKVLLFGLVWCFITFLPQSLTGLTRYDVPYLFNSISRHLYIPSVGPAIVFSAILLSIKAHFSRKVFVITGILFFAIFILTNYERGHARGKQWQEEGIVWGNFLYQIKKLHPTIPENSYIHVVGAPSSYTLRVLRAFYKNPKIYWTDEPGKDAFIYLYLSGILIDDHKSIMRLAPYLHNISIDPFLRFYELKGWEKEKLEFLQELSEALRNDAERHIENGYAG